MNMMNDDRNPLADGEWDGAPLGSMADGAQEVSSPEALGLSAEPLPSRDGGRSQAAEDGEAPASLPIQEGLAAEGESSPPPLMPRVLAESLGLPAPEPLTVPADPLSLRNADAVPEGDGEEVSAKSPQGQRYWRRVLTGNPHTVPEEVRQRAGAEDDGLSEEQREYMLYTSINRSWAVDHLGYEREDVELHWPEQRAELARRLGVADDEQEVFLALSHRVSDEPRRKVSREIYERAWAAGVNGEDGYDIRDLSDQLLPADGEMAESLALEAFAEGQALREKWMPVARVLADGMDVFSAVEDDAFSAPRVFRAAPGLWRAVGQLEDMGEEDRRMAMWFAASLMKQQRKQKEEGEEGLFHRSLRAVRRNASGLGYSMLQGVNQLGVATMESMGSALGGSTGSSLSRGAEDWDRRLNILHELRELVTGEVQPLLPPDASRAEEYLIAAAEAAPSAVLSFCGGAGFAALTVAGTGEAVAEARRRSPETPQELQFAAGVVAGALQASIYAGMGRVGGKVLEQSLSRFMRDRGASMPRYSLDALMALGGMTAEGVGLVLAGKAAGAAGLASQELASRAAGTASNIDWRDYGENMVDVEANMREAASVLPFILIGSGRVALRHFRSKEAVLGDGSPLKAWGIEEGKIEELMKESDVDRQSDMLRDMLRGSKRWSAPGFVMEALRSLRLLNVDYFEGFKDKEVVRDFLELPAESSKVQRPEPEPMDWEAMMNEKSHAVKRFSMKRNITTEEFRMMIHLWDEWWRKAHVNAYSSRMLLKTTPKQDRVSPRTDRTGAYVAINENPYREVPLRMRQSGAYAPYAEEDRRALLRDRVMELKDLSYQFLLHVYPPASMLYSDIYNLCQFPHYANKTRNNALGEVAKAVLRTALGTPRKASLDQLEAYFGRYYASRKYRGTIPDWLKGLTSGDLKYHFAENARNFRDPKWKDRPEILEGFRIVTGLRAGANVLLDLLPLTEDFQTALSRGMTPPQAYHHLLVRELEFDPKRLKFYPFKELEESANVTPRQSFVERNAELCKRYTRLTGLDFEQATGEDGRSYWRLKRPDGRFSRWHESREHAANDVAANAALTFMPMGDGAGARLQRMSRRPEFNFYDMVKTDPGAFSGHDQLCSIATRDLAGFWLEDFSRVQMGLYTYLPKGSHFYSVRGGDGLTPWIRGQSADHEQMWFDPYTMVTPLSMAQGRFRIYWERMLGSGMLTREQAGEFLSRSGMSVDDPGADQKAASVEVQNARMAERLTEFTTHYFLANLMRLPVPQSVKTWYATSAFAPDLTEEDAGDSKFKVVAMGRSRTGLIHWSNQQTSVSLHQFADQVERFRSLFADGELGDPFLRQMVEGAMGLNAEQNYEQGWCMDRAGIEGVQACPQSCWNLMLHPLRAWQGMSAEDRADMAHDLEPFFKEDPAPDVQELRLEGREPDEFFLAVRNLDEVLQEFPQLHGFAPAKDDPFAVRVQLLQEKPAEMGRWEEPLTTPLPLYTPGEARASASFRVSSQLPPYLQDNVRGMHALRFLEALRNYASSLPCSLDTGIWWNGRLVGGSVGMAPPGLEKWVPEEPLLPLRNMLLGLHERQKQQEKPLEVCGIPLPGLAVEELRPRELGLITVYRRPEYRDILYRLMPGDPLSESSRARGPYLVGNRMGVYLQDGLAMQEASDMDLIMTPLHRFKRAPLRMLTETRRMEMMRASIEHSLDSLLQKAAGVEDNNASGLTELMLRIYEDTGFSYSLGGKNPADLTPPAAWLLQLASHLIECASQVPGMFHESYRNLANLATRLRDQPVMRERIVDHLMNCGENLKKDSGYYGRMMEALQDELDALEGKAPVTEKETDD